VSRDRVQTLVREGSLGGPDVPQRPYALRREGGVPAAYVCLGCRREIPLDRDAFIAHACGRRRRAPRTPRAGSAARASIPTTTTTEGAIE